MPTSAEVVNAELTLYLKTKKIDDLFTSMVESLLLSTPDNPVQFIIDHLKAKYPEKFTLRNENRATLPHYVSYANEETSSSDESADDDDDVSGEHPSFVPPFVTKARRLSVSAECVDGAM